MQQESIEGFRLSPQQRRIWSLQDRGVAFRAQCALRLDGELRLLVLKKAVENIIERHEILRTNFRWLPGMKGAVQAINIEGSPAWRELDLSSLSRSTREMEIQELWMQERKRPFDLEQGPLLHLTLATLSPREHLLLVSLPSICADSWTLKTFLQQLATEYDALLAGESYEEQVVQYVQFVEWQNELLESEEAESGKRYWKQLPCDASHASDLPWQIAGAGEQEFAPEQLIVTLGPQMGSKLLAVADRHGAAADEVLLAAWHTLVWRLTGDPQVIVGRVFEGRDYEGLMNAFGAFSRCLPSVARFAPSVPFSSIVRQVAAATPAMAEAQDYFDTDNEQLGGNSGLGKRADGTTFFPFVFAFEEWPNRIDLRDLTFTIQSCYVCGERFSLMLKIIRAADRLGAEFLYDSARFHANDIRYLGNLFGTLVASAIENPETAVGALEILGEVELRQLLLDCNGTQADFPRDACIHEEFAAQAARTPGAVAVVCGEEQLSYGELEGRANKLARYLRGRGLGCEERVGLLLGRSLAESVAVLGVLKSGAAYVPLDVLSPRARVQQVLAEAGVQVVLTEIGLAELVSGSGVEVVCLDGVEGAEIELESEEQIWSGVQAQNLAYVIYTSGSTGKPKGVMVQHRSLSNLAAALKSSIYQSLGESLRVGLNAPLTFDASVKQWLQLLDGHTLVLLPDEVRYDAAELLVYAQTHRIEVLDCTPVQLRSLLAAGLLDEGGRSLSAVLVGGEKLDEKTWELVASSPTTRFYNVYGPTECTVDASICLLQPEKLCPSIGRPIANTQIYLLDQELQPVPHGVVAEVFIGGEGVARGYLGRAELTAESFIPDPFSLASGARLYRTGDLARYLPGGELELRGRRDHQVKIRGIRIELGEIEAVLKTHPAIGEAVVSVRDDGFEEKHLVAYASLRMGAEQLPAEDDLRRDLRSFLREKLPEYMIPATFATLDRLPLTRHGKVDRNALPDPTPQTSTDERYLQPRNEIERTIAAIWREVLAVEKVGVHDNFFDLGGHSLLMAHAYGKLRAAVTAELSMIDLFRHPTVSSLAEFLSRGEPESVTHEKIQQRVGKRQAALDRQRQLMLERRHG